MWKLDVMCREKKKKGDIATCNPKAAQDAGEQSTGMAEGVGRGRNVMQIGGGKVIQSTHLKMIRRTLN
jgi:hypothetical protein